MRRLALLLAFGAFIAPAAAAGQVALLGGAGVGRPIGDFGDAAAPGWHALAGLQVGVPAIPIALRVDGSYHSFGAPANGLESSILAGTGSLVLTLPGVGLVPYFLGGVGQYRVSLDQNGVDPVTDNGIHGAFGVNIGAMGFGGYAEIRVVNISQSAGDARFVTATLGLRP